MMTPGGAEPALATAMKTRSRAAFSVPELLIVVAVLALLGALFVVQYNQRARRRATIPCLVNQKQIGLAFAIWRTDNQERFPMQVSTNHQGSQEWVPSGTVAPLFTLLSNEIYRPRLLHCPQDLRRSPATNFAHITESNVSYFLNVDADATNSSVVLLGDRNLTNRLSPHAPFIELTRKSALGWDAALHRRRGFACLIDGSVQPFTNGSAAVAASAAALGSDTNRLAVP